MASSRPSPIMSFASATETNGAKICAFEGFEPDAVGEVLERLAVHMEMERRLVAEHPDRMEIIGQEGDGVALAHRELAGLADGAASRLGAVIGALVADVVLVAIDAGD